MRSCSVASASYPCRLRSGLREARLGRALDHLLAQVEVRVGLGAIGARTGRFAGCLPPSRRRLERVARLGAGVLGGVRRTEFVSAALPSRCALASPDRQASSLLLCMLLLGSRCHATSAGARYVPAPLDVWRRERGSSAALHRVCSRRRQARAAPSQPPLVLGPLRSSFRLTADAGPSATFDGRMGSSVSGITNPQEVPAWLIPSQLTARRGIEMQIRCRSAAPS